jgi:hypothetical protein
VLVSFAPVLGKACWKTRVVKLVETVFSCSAVPCVKL